MEDEKQEGIVKEPEEKIQSPKPPKVNWGQRKVLDKILESEKSEINSAEMAANREQIEENTSHGDAMHTVCSGETVSEYTRPASPPVNWSRKSTDTVHKKQQVPNLPLPDESEQKRVEASDQRTLHPDRGNMSASERKSAIWGHPVKEKSPWSRGNEPIQEPVCPPVTQPDKNVAAAAAGITNKICPRCGSQNPVYARFCCMCGGDLPLYCSVCKKMIPLAGARYCPYCGGKL